MLLNKPLSCAENLLQHASSTTSRTIVQQCLEILISKTFLNKLYFKVMFSLYLFLRCMYSYREGNKVSL